MPSFCRDGVTFTKFICERKNGDMFEGLAKDIDGGDGQMPVIVMVSCYSYGQLLFLWSVVILRLKEMAS